MSAIEVITGNVTNQAALTGVTFAAGDTGSVRNFRADKKAFLIGLWSYVSVAGQVRLRSPRLHDNVNNLTFTNKISAALGGQPPASFIPKGVVQEVKSQDTLIFEGISAGAGVIGVYSYQLYYQDVEGASGRFIDTKVLSTRMVNVMTCTLAIAAGVTGGYSGVTALTAMLGSANLKANVDYALIGYNVYCSAADGNIGTIGFRGVDTGNLRIGMPGNSQNNAYTSRYFMDLSDQFSVPMIPVINAANRAGVVVDLANGNIANTATVDLIFAELA